MSHIHGLSTATMEVFYLKNGLILSFRNLLGVS